MVSDLVAGCPDCHGTKMVAVMICEEPQVRTCLTCFRRDRPEAPGDPLRFEPMGMPEAGTVAEYRAGLRREHWRLAW